MENIVEKIRRLCGEKGVKVSRIEKDLGYGNGFLNPKKQSDIQVSRLLAILDYLQIPITEFFAAENSGGEPTFPELTDKYASLDDHGRRMVDLVLDTEYERCNTVDEAEEKITYIRHYLYSPAAGPNGLVSGEDYEDIPLPADAPKEADYCLTVSGDSMEPYIKDGSLVYVKEDAPLNSMDVGIFFVDGSTYCKQYAPGYTGEIYLLSANPARQDANLTIYPDGGSTLVYFGKVLLDHKLPAPSYF